MGRFFSIVLLLHCGLLLAQEPLSDLSNGDLRNVISFDSKSHFMMPAYSGINSWLPRKQKITQQILASAGLLPMPEKTPLDAERFGRSVHHGFSVEKIILHPLPGFRLAGNLYLPEKRMGKIPGVLLAHGHWKHGRIHDAEDYSVPALAATLASRGYAVFAYDMIGYNDTRQLPHKFGDSKTEMLWSFGPMGLQLWNSIRALDFLQGLPEVDAARLGMTGTSGGGTQTLLLSVIDERIRAAAPGGMVSATFQGDDGCEEAPGLHLGLSNLEIAAAMAPRPLLLLSATGDWTKNTPYEELPAIRSVYRLFNKENEVGNAHIDAGHNCNRESRKEIYAFFDLNLLGAARAEIPEADITSILPAQLLIGSGSKQQIQNQIFNQWRSFSLKQVGGMSVEALRARLRLILGLSENRTRMVAIPTGDRLILENQDGGERVTAYWRPGRLGSPVLLVHPRGLRAAMESAEARKFASQGHPLLFVQPYLADLRKVRPQISRHELTFQRSVDTNRVRDLVLALRFLALQNTDPKHRPQVVCLGESSAWCLAAAAASYSPVQLSLDLRELNASDESFNKGLFIPGIQRAGGLPVLLQLTRTTHGAIEQIH